jgi:hypothetical protein
MALLPASPAAHRRELEHRERARLEQFERKLDHALVMVKDAGSNAPSLPTEEDSWDLAVTLADNGTGGLPLHSHIETTSVDTTTPLQRPYGKVYTTIATSITVFPLDPMTPPQALLCGLLDKSGRFSPTVYERMVKETPGIISGRLMGPREAMLDNQRAGQKARPGLWHA